jgi:VIT1/CCC1 family predicted Fe2+/Mn2+ transporter
VVIESPHAERHRPIADGWARAAIFGASDGLVTNVSLILGFAGAHPGHSVVRLAGLAGLVAGGFSMASGEYLSVRAQRELFEREIEVERRALARYPEAEQRELSEIFKSRGIEADLAERLAGDLMRDPELALRTHTREELGIDPSSVGSPWKAAIWSLLSFSIGAFIPLLPWLFDRWSQPVLWSVLLGGLGTAAVGGVVGWFTQRGVVRSALRQLFVTGLAALVTFGVGRGVGAG